MSLFKIIGPIYSNISAVNIILSEINQKEK